MALTKNGSISSDNTASWRTKRKCPAGWIGQNNPSDQQGSRHHQTVSTSLVFPLLFQLHAGSSR